MTKRIAPFVAAPKTVASTPTTGSSFLTQFIEQMQNSSMDELNVWAMTNAGTMKESMFFDPSVDWSKIGPGHLIVFRAIADPGKVFTKFAYKEIKDNTPQDFVLQEMADVLFADDATFLRYVAQNYNAFYGPTKDLMRWAQMARESGTLSE